GRVEGHAAPGMLRVAILRERIENAFRPTASGRCELINRPATTGAASSTTVVCGAIEVSCLVEDNVSAKRVCSVAPSSEKIQRSLDPRAQWCDGRIGCRLHVEDCATATRT